MQEWSWRGLELSKTLIVTPMSFMSGPETNTQVSHLRPLGFNVSDNDNGLGD